MQGFEQLALYKAMRAIAEAEELSHQRLRQQGKLKSSFVLRQKLGQTLVQWGQHLLEQAELQKLNTASGLEN